MRVSAARSSAAVSVCREANVSVLSTPENEPRPVNDNVYMRPPPVGWSVTRT
jgi:hypothetical protein